MHYRGILFDFNGTLLFDSDKHRDAWNLFLREKLNRTITDEEVAKECLGQTNATILRRYFGNDLPESEISRLAYEKEDLYRHLCKQDTEHFHLVRGAAAYFDHIAALGIPFTIATGSELSNVEFYFREFGIGKWFSLDRMVWDDGKLPGKPAPDVYIAAAGKLGLSPSECLIFEDSVSGIQSAIAANAHAVVQIAKAPGTLPEPGVTLLRSDFTDVAAFDAL